MDIQIKAQIEEILNAPTCYPECERKSREIRESDLIEWYKKYSEVNICYNLYGQDTDESNSQDDWLDRGIFRKQRHDVNGRYYPFGSKFPYDYTLIMRDKRCFEMFMKTIFGDSHKYCRSFGCFMNRKLLKYTTQGGLIEISIGEFLETFEGKKVVFKNTFGYGGDDILICKVEHNKVFVHDREYSAKDFFGTIYQPNSIWLIQGFLLQHSFMSDLNPTSVNTMRILTYNTGESVQLGKTVLRFGKPGSTVDNCDMGGLFAGVDFEGFIGESQFSFVEKKRSRCMYSGQTIPFFLEATKLVLEAHSQIPELFTIGWDVVVTPDGPIILEGNDGWDPYLTQAPLGNEQRTTWDRLLNIRNKVLGIQGV